MKQQQNHSGQGDNIQGNKNVEHIADDKIVTNTSNYHLSVKGWTVIAFCVTTVIVSFLYLIGEIMNIDGGGNAPVGYMPSGLDGQDEAKKLSYEEHFELGASYADNAKDYDKAIYHFSKAIEFDPERPEAYYGRGTAYNVKGENQKAIEDLSMAINLGYTYAYGNLGWLYFDISEYDSAYESFIYHLQSYDDALSYCGAAVCLYMLNKVREAKRMYLKAIKLDPRFDGNFGALQSDYLFNSRQMQAIKSLYSEFR